MVNLEKNVIVHEREMGLPPVPFQVKVAQGVPMLKIVTGICASAPISELAVIVTS